MNPPESCARIPESIPESYDASKRINTAVENSDVSEDETMTDCDKKKICETDSFISAKELVNDELHTSKKEIKTKLLKKSLFEKPKLKLNVRYLPAGSQWKVVKIVSTADKNKSPMVCGHCTPSLLSSCMILKYKKIGKN